MHDFDPPNGTTIVRNDSIKHVTFLRHPLLRLRDQYYADRQRDAEQKKKDAGFQESRFSYYTFEECAKSASCRHHYEFARWGNIQTKILCGWNAAVCRYDKWLNATEPMLLQALANLEHNFSFVGLSEEWDASMELMEKMLPVHFEGLHSNVTQQTCSASEKNSQDEWCGGPPVTEETGSALVVATQALSITSVPALDALLRHFVWGDLILYEKAQELFYDKAQMCDVKTLKQMQV